MDTLGIRTGSLPAATHAHRCLPAWRVVQNSARVFHSTLSLSPRSKLQARGVRIQCEHNEAIHSSSAVPVKCMVDIHATSTVVMYPQGYRKNHPSKKEAQLHSFCPAVVCSSPVRSDGDYHIGAGSTDPHPTELSIL